MNFCCVQNGFGMWWIMTTDKTSALTSQGAGSYNFLSWGASCILSNDSKVCRGARRHRLTQQWWRTGSEISRTKLKHQNHSQQSLPARCCLSTNPIGWVILWMYCIQTLFVIYSRIQAHSIELVRDCKQIEKSWEMEGSSHQNSLLGSVSSCRVHLWI
jgi:hypothetical protein